MTTAARTLLLVVGLWLFCHVTASAGPLATPVTGAPAAGTAPPAAFETAALVCGPYRCFDRPFWRYGAGTGFRPFAPFGYRPFRRPGYSPFPFGPRRFDDRRR